jgi:drug/metabolite transporter (DMT)-like permease
MAWVDRQGAHRRAGGINLQSTETEARAGGARPSRGDNVRLGVAVILATTLAMSLGDAAIKLLSADFALSQIFVLRSLITIPVLIAIIRLRSRTASLMPRHIGWVALRSLMLTFLWVAYYWALPHLALGVAAATFYTLPLFITIFAAIFIKDKIGAKGWGAVVLGFVGALLILKPDAGGFNAYALLPLAAAILDALAMILTRTKCREESPLILSLGVNISVFSVGLLATVLIPTAGDSAGASFLLGEWSPMGASEWLTMALLAAAAIVASVGAATAYQVGPPVTIATFDFAYIGFAGLWGILIFAEFPNATTIFGIMLIVIGGIVAVRR